MRLFCIEEEEKNGQGNLTIRNVEHVTTWHTFLNTVREMKPKI